MRTPANVIAQQIMVMESAIDFLQNKIRQVTSEIHPDSATWADTAVAEMAAEMAADFLHRVNTIEN